MIKGNFDNSLSLVRHILRRERVISAVWIVLLAVFSAALAPALDSMFPDIASRSQFAASMDNPMMVSMMGPIYGKENYTSGAMYGGMMLLWYIILVAVMNIFFIVRNTRADEELGRSEVVRSLPTGRLANINAAMLSAVIINAALALFTGLGIAAMGIESIGFSESMLYGAVSGAAGLVFAAMTALFCQLSVSPGGASGLSFISIGVCYMMRALGDIRGIEFISCLSPMGLAQRSQVYIQNNIWPVFVLLAEAAAVTAVAYMLNSIRDLGQGFIAAKPGRRTASVSMSSPMGFAFRLLRKSVITWITVMFVLGASYASVVADISSFVSDSPEYLNILGVPVEMLEHLSSADKDKLIVDSFVSFVITIMTIVCIVPLLGAAMKARSEEKENRAEHIIARPVSRTKYLAGFVFTAYLSSLLIQFATASGMYLAADAMAGDANPFTFGGITQSFLLYLPALWVMIGIAVLFVGLLPKLTGVVWGLMGLVFFTSFIGSMALPEWFLNVSPLYHIPTPQPFEVFEPSLTPLIILTAIAAAATAAGFIFYNRRDTLSS